jgi:hypothetical protein
MSRSIDDIIAGMVPHRASRRMAPGELVVWEGKQWLVTSAVLQGGLHDATSRHPRITIPAAELCAGLETDYTPTACWLICMAGEPWCDYKDFERAFLIACVAHGIQSPHIGKAIEAAREQHDRKAMPALRRI